MVPSLGGGDGGEHFHGFDDDDLVACLDFGTGGKCLVPCEKWEVEYLGWARSGVPYGRRIRMEEDDWGGVLGLPGGHRARPSLGLLHNYEEIIGIHLDAFSD